MKNFSRFVTAFAVAVIGFTTNGISQPPPPGGGFNDSCEVAIEVSCGDIVSGSTLAAGLLDAPAACGTALNTSGGVWYKYTGDGSAVTVTTCDVDTDFDTKLGVFSGDCNSLVCVGGNDDDAACGNTQSSVGPFTGQLGVDYYIYVTGFGTATGHFDLKINCADPCSITNVVLGDQGACDPSTNTYTQDLRIFFENAPATGTIDVNGQSFPVSAVSPQIVTLTGLASDGLAVDIDVSYSDDLVCTYSASALWTAPTDCFDPCPGSTVLMAEDFNSCSLPAGWSNNILAGDSGWIFVLNSPDAFNAGNIDGSCMAFFDDDYLGSAAPASTVELVSPSFDMSSGGNLDLSFDYNYFHLDLHPSRWMCGMEQLMNVLTETADNVGAWGNGPPYPNFSTPLTGYTNGDFQIRFTYDDNGGEWDWYVGIDNVRLCLFPLAACDISSATAGTQSPCDPLTSTYDQDVVIEYVDPPASGTLDVNGVSFLITGSPQTVTLSGLAADGLPVDVDVSFSDDLFCSNSFNAVFTAPVDCFDPCANSTQLIWENFDDCMMPAGWQNNAISGDSLWLFVATSPDAGNAGSIDGSCMALFDDDYVDADGGDIVELITAPVDVSGMMDLQLSFDYNFQNLTVGADSFYVEVWDGANWNQIIETDDNVGAWGAGPSFAN